MTQGNIVGTRLVVDSNTNLEIKEKFLFRKSESLHALQCHRVHQTLGANLWEQTNAVQHF